MLTGLRVFEAASFVAGPFATLQLAQLGAEVIRIDPIGGGPDFRRWPLSQSGDSFFWEGLNKGKKSVAINMSDPEGRELMQALISAPDSDGCEAGYLVTNFPEKGFLSHQTLAQRRKDQVTLRVTGWPDGAQAVDYTINPAVGIPMMTGPAERSEVPVNHVLPAWDLLAGSTVALSLLAARDLRRRTGQGGEFRVPLSDIAATTVANLGMLAEVLTAGKDRPKMDNRLFGSFGRDFVTRDGERIMIVGLTTKQWHAIITALEIDAEVKAVETELGQRLDLDAGLRFTYRASLERIVAAAVGQYEWDVLEPRLTKSGVCYGKYRTLFEASGDPIFCNSFAFSEVTQPSGYTYPAPGFAGSLTDAERKPPRKAPHLGSDSVDVLRDSLNLPDNAINDLVARGLVAGPPS